MISGSVDGIVGEGICVDGIVVDEIVVDGIVVDEIEVDGIVLDRIVVYEILVDGIVDENGVFLTLYTKRFKLTFVKTQLSSGR